MQVESLTDFKSHLQHILDRNTKSLKAFGETHATQIKTYLIESNAKIVDLPLLGSTWRKMETKGWYSSEGGKHGGQFFLDSNGKRVWRLFSTAKADSSDGLVQRWMQASRGLDACWLPREHLLHWSKIENWRERGVGLRYQDALTSTEDSAAFSLKAWRSPKRILKSLDKLINEAEEELTIHSIRWEHRNNGTVDLLAESFNDGKITFTRADDVDDVLYFSSELATSYENLLSEADRLRTKFSAPFELGFSQKVDLDAFGTCVRAGRGPLKLWLTEVEREGDDLRRYRGVDMHTGDRVALDMGKSFAYLSVPKQGCVNAVTRLASVQGESITGKTTIFFDGEPLIAGANH